ncbi:MAG: hypothetical protein TH68_02900 [Candidatus Synechococcus spongiarum 142]|uniref:Uncharacterized protein n=1 Tax=Candidatus Synechococcus spongiarum 142 TaxID=1608213 RepID=A0A6N3X7J8_9SYNE|nr:MAG: hypothetical protein TH68_02900 [Candidatus Synechococcus spongiarum 142]
MACVYSLIIGLPRIRRELSAMETVACTLIVSLCLLVLGFNLTKDTHPQIADGFVLVEIGLAVVVLCLWVVRLVAQRRQSR